MMRPIGDVARGGVQDYNGPALPDYRGPVLPDYHGHLRDAPAIGGHHTHLASPLAAAEHLMEGAIPILVGVVLGFIVLLALRAGGLRFTWALAVGAPAAYLAWPLEWQVGLGCAVAALSAGVAGAHWHFQDIGRGGEKARRAREALGPARCLISQLQRRRAKERRVEARRVRNGPGRRLEDTLAIGERRGGGVCRVLFGALQGVHGLIVGASGAGKTVTLLAIATAHIRAGAPVIFLDPKGEEHPRRVLIEAARAAGRRFLEWSPSGPTVYNPLGRGNPTEIADKALGVHRWKEEHYEVAIRRVLETALKTMRAAGIWPPTISDIVRYTDPLELDLLTEHADEGRARETRSYLDGLSARAKTDLDGGRNRLALLGEADFGRWLDPKKAAGAPLLRLEESLREGDVVYINLEADRYPELAKLLGAALVIDLVTLTSERQGKRLPGLVVIDEFAAVAADRVSRLFARARSAGISVALGAQSLADLRAARPEDPTDSLTEQVLSNVSYVIAHRIGDPDSAERLARVAGTMPSWSTTERVGGSRGIGAPREGTRTPEREFIVAPDELKGLAPGEAAVITPTAKRRAQIVRIWPPPGS